MIVNGYAKGYRYSGDGTLYIKVRIPTIHGPYTESENRGNKIYNYVRDEDLPYYQSILLPSLPNDGEVVALATVKENISQFMVIGLTGGSYFNGTRLD